MAAVETASPMMGTAAACDALGVPRASRVSTAAASATKGLRGRRRHVR